MQVDGDSVTASALVRNFGLWQERALQTPVYILHHGRPRLVLASVDHARASAPAVQSASLSDRDTLLEVIDDLVVMLDRDGRITALSAAARAYFGVTAGSEQHFSGLFADAARPILASAIERVFATGLLESVETRGGPYPDRRLAIRLTPCEAGLLAIVRDRTLLDERALADAQIRAMLACTDALGSIGLIRLNPQGYIVQASPSFSAITGLATDALLSARLVTLLDVPSRVTFGEAFASVAMHDDTRRVDGTLLVNHGPPRRVRMALTPLLEHIAVMVELAGEHG